MIETNVVSQPSSVLAKFLVAMAAFPTKVSIFKRLAMLSNFFTDTKDVRSRSDVVTA